MPCSPKPAPFPHLTLFLNPSLFPKLAPVAVPRPRRPPTDALAPVASLPDGVDGGWAVAEIRPDGSLGP